MDEIIQEFHDNNDVVYIMTARVNGKVIAKATSKISADDLVGDAHKLDTAMHQFIASDQQDRIDDIADAQVQEMLDRK